MSHTDIDRPLGPQPNDADSNDRPANPDPGDESPAPTHSTDAELAQREQDRELATGEENSG